MNAVVPRSSQTALRQPVLTPQNFDQLMTFADMAASSDLVPKDYRGKPSNIVIAVQMGGELGLQPMQALNSITVINGRPGVWGDGLLGLCRQSDLCEDIREWYDGEGDAHAAHCEAKRRGASPVLSSFSIADAKRAGLWNKAGPWTQYPDRMLKNRARGFALRDAFPDLLRGLKTVEELQDFPREARQEPIDVTPPRRHEPTPQRRPAPPTIDQSLNGDQIPDFDEPPPRPDRDREITNRIAARLAAVNTNQDAYNEIMQHKAMQAEWKRIEKERPELAAELEEARQVALDGVANAHADMPA